MPKRQARHMARSGRLQWIGPDVQVLLKVEGRRFGPTPDHNIATLALAR